VCVGMLFGIFQVGVHVYAGGLMRDNLPRRTVQRLVPLVPAVQRCTGVHLGERLVCIGAHQP
jgi:hypothetical protein